jgi:hypothetical protein
MQTWCLMRAVARGRVRLITETLWLEPYWGKLNVQNFREGAGDVNHGGTYLYHTGYGDGSPTLCMMSPGTALIAGMERIVKNPNIPFLQRLREP